HGAAQIAAELPVHAGVDELAVLPGRVACARALARERYERPLVLARDAERAVVARLDAPRPLARVGRPGVAARTVVGHRDGGREAAGVPLACPRPARIGCAPRPPAGV